MKCLILLLITHFMLISANALATPLSEVVEAEITVVTPFGPESYYYFQDGRMIPSTKTTEVEVSRPYCYVSTHQKVEAGTKFTLWQAFEQIRPYFVSSTLKYQHLTSLPFRGPEPEKSEKRKTLSIDCYGPIDSFATKITVDEAQEALGGHFDFVVN